MFLFSVEQIGKKCWPEIELYGTFLAPGCCPVLLNQHQLSKPFSGYVSKWKYETQRYKRDTIFFWDTIYLN